MAWTDEEHDKVLEGLAVVCEVTGTDMSDAAKRFMLTELERTYAAKDALVAIRKTARTCRGKLSLADVVKAADEVDRKALSDARAARSVYLTQLRGCALMERIAWNDRDPDAVRKELEAKGYRFGATSERPVKSLPHWSETEPE